MKIKETLWLFILSATTLFFGVMYSIYNTDPHHWGFIAGTALDFIHGKCLFTETYIQYGVGQPLLFKILSAVMKVNYTNIGVIASACYSLTLVFIYFSAKKLSNGTIAFFCTLIAFLLHSYSIYPWPDYFAGLCLSIACYRMIQEKKNLLPYVDAGAFLFFAFLFRNTYLISILVSSVVYLLFAAIFRHLRDKRLFTTIGVFIGLVAVYLTFLFAQGTLTLWYQQTIGAGTSEYGIDFRSVLTLLERAFLLNGLQNGVLSILFYVSFLGGLALIFKRGKLQFQKLKNGEGVLLFFAFLGLTGLAQALLGYEIFRIQNACSPVYLVFAFYLGEKFSKKSFSDFSFEAKLLITVLFVSLTMRFPHGSSLYPIYEGSLSSYQASQIPFYQGHRFQKPEIDYYDGLVKTICIPGAKLVNLTMDSSIPFLCEGQTNVLSLPFYVPALLKKTNPALMDKINRGEFENNEIVVSNGVIEPGPTTKLTEIGQVMKPALIRFTDVAHPLRIYRAEKK